MQDFPPGNRGWRCKLMLCKLSYVNYVTKVMRLIVRTPVWFCNCCLALWFFFFYSVLLYAWLSGVCTVRLTGAVL